MLYERFERINSQISFFLLLRTQFALPLLIAYKCYIQGLFSYCYEGLGVILLLSMLSYWAARFHLTGILPVISLLPFFCLRIQQAGTSGEACVIRSVKFCGDITIISLK